MIAGLLILTIYVFLVWLIFFKFKFIKFSITWGVISAFVGVHVLLSFYIGLRFVTPYSKDAKVIQRTIQLIPRLPEPTLVTAVLVEPNTPVKKGQPLFQFDRRPYQYKVDSAKAQWESAKYAVVQAEAARSGLKAALSAATYNVAEARANQATSKDALQVATATVGEARAAVGLAKDKLVMAQGLQKQDIGAISQLTYDKAQQNFKEAEATLKVDLDTENKARAAVETAFESVQVAVANGDSARVAYELQAPAAIEIARANVKNAEAELAQANYYLDNTTMVAPEDGQVINLQVQPGMVSGIIRIGAIASFIVDADRYVLATYNQENLKYVKSGQPVEVAFDLYPGQIFNGKVDCIWWGSGEGQMLPSGDLPKFSPPAPDVPQGRFAVKILLDAEDQSKFPIGAQGSAAIYTSGGGFAALRRIVIRAHSWLNWLYPLAG